MNIKKSEELKMNENAIVCSKCGEILSEDSGYYFDEQHLCQYCYDEYTTTCNNCGATIWRDESEGDSEISLCSSCYDRYYTTCEGCNGLLHNDDAYYEDDDDYPYCRNCYESRHGIIKSYNYKPEPIFYGSGDLFYGIELEIDKGGEDCINAQKILDVANEEENRIYIKHDGSINSGFEIVSHPMSYKYHLNKMNWSDVLNKAISMEYRSHNTSTCGLHIHCSRSAFGKTYDLQEQSIARVVYFVEKHWNELVRFSRRTIDNLNRWAAKYAALSETTEETYKKAKNRGLGRYVAVNLNNFETVEFRMWRGTLRYSTFIATLQLVDEICKCAINMNDYEMENMSWLDFVQRISPEKAELISYLKEKMLYVNELSTESEEM